MNEVTISLTVNGEEHRLAVPARMTLADLLRERLDLTGTHLGCEHGVCGACTVLVDGAPVRACIALAATCSGSQVTTIEGLHGPLVERVRSAFSEEHGLQCGFCTPGMVVASCDIIRRKPDADNETIRAELSGNICRCTGYVGIVRAIARAASESIDLETMEVES